MNKKTILAISLAGLLLGCNDNNKEPEFINAFNQNMLIKGTINQINGNEININGYTIDLSSSDFFLNEQSINELELRSGFFVTVLAQTNGQGLELKYSPLVKGTIDSYSFFPESFNIIGNNIFPNDSTIISEESLYDNYIGLSFTTSGYILSDNSIVPSYINISEPSNEFLFTGFTSNLIDQSLSYFNTNLDFSSSNFNYTTELTEATNGNYFISNGIYSEPDFIIENTSLYSNFYENNEVKNVSIKGYIENLTTNSFDISGITINFNGDDFSSYVLEEGLLVIAETEDSELTSLVITKDEEFFLLGIISDIHGDSFDIINNEIIVNSNTIVHNQVISGNDNFQSLEVDSGLFVTGFYENDRFIAKKIEVISTPDQSNQNSIYAIRSVLNYDGTSFSLMNTDLTLSQGTSFVILSVDGDSDDTFFTESEFIELYNSLSDSQTINASAFGTELNNTLLTSEITFSIVN